MTDHLTQLRLDEATSTSDVLAPDPLIVRLNKAFFWYHGPSRWPYYLSRAQAGRAYTKAEIIEDIFLEDRSQRKFPESGWLSYIYGLRIDRTAQEVTVEGIGLFERSSEDQDQYRITDDGLLLARTYHADRDSNDWRRIFAGILARNDVRVRCVLLHLSRWQSFLTFRNGTTEEAFFVPGRGGSLKASDGSETAMFEQVKDREPVNNFTVLLQRDPVTILGPFLRERITASGLLVPQNVVFEGGRRLFGVTKEPSVNHLRDYIRQALSLFRDIGALVYVPHRQGWTLDRERCATLFEPALVADLFGGAPASRFLDALRVTYDKFSDAEGLVRVTDIRDYVCDELDVPTGERIDYFNQQVAYYMRPDVGKLSIGRTFHAQAGPSDCLFGDLAQEYVQFIFTSA